MSAGVAGVAEIRREVRAEGLRTAGRSVARALLNAVVTLAIVLALWQGVVSLGGISPFVAKGPLDVWNHLFVTEPDAFATAAERRAVLLPLVTVTLKDAALGFVVGMAIAVALAMAFTLSKTVEAGVMPLALLLRSVPLVSIAPVIMLLTGRGTPESVAVIGTIVVLFPALASVLFGLSQANPQSVDLVRVYGGGNLAALLKVAVPGALPSLFAAARVSVPGAVTGALLAEWLSTGKGIGGNIVKFNAAAQFDNLWACVAIITLVTLVLYNLVLLVENLVLAEMGMSQRGS
ncbi:ABC transporter permease subunit [Nocardioides zeae]|uniref:ABC transporter permease subunit n=1 Tax=Nocardioides imazamoxiresistens TaxID=3231893 RepID=A0ABU3PQK3_9ACTN|nr:ABC transporter permease subunit [Nocardioides zeae]MDT9591502.1 ABC transporter permease subunit [Nocardioides zeae]